MKLTLILLISLGLVAMALSCSDEEWSNFKKQYDKKYDSKEEDAHRRKIFCENVKSIAEHNERFERGEIGYDKAINVFADLTKEEFASSFGR